MNGTPGARPRAAASAADQQNGLESPRPCHSYREPLGPGTLRHPRERTSRMSGELCVRNLRNHSETAAVHLGLKESLKNLRGKVSNQSDVGGRQLQQELQLQTQWQEGDQETCPDDKCEVAGHQVLQTKVRACAHWSLLKTVRPSSRRQMLLVWWRR